MNIFANFDVAQLSLYLFWLFFAGLVVYLQREALREGYPMESEKDGKPFMAGPFGDIPSAKTFKLPHGRGDAAYPDVAKEKAIIAKQYAMKPTAPWSGSPFEPTGDPMADGVGPAAWAERQDIVELTIDGHERIVPFRAHEGWDVASEGPDIRGWNALGCDGKAAGKVLDYWVDRSESILRYIEVDLGERTVLVPWNAVKVAKSEKVVKVDSIRADQFAGIPGLKDPHSITRLEEERVMAYVAGGKMYASMDRQEPWL